MATHAGRTSQAARPRRVTLVAVWLALTGTLTAFYGGLIPLLPPLVTTPVPLVATAIGLAGVVAAVGVWRIAGWGRWLGVGVLLLGIVRAAAVIVWRLGRGGSPGEGAAVDAGVIAGIALDAVTWVLTFIVLWILLRRWPPDNKSG